MIWNKRTCYRCFVQVLEFAHTVHGLIVLSGLFVGLCYFPAWFGYLFKRAMEGATSWFLILVMLGFIGVELWQQRHSIRKIIPNPEDRTLGHALIVFGVFLYPFCRFALWSQAIVWLMILLGVVISSWGLPFLLQHKLSTFFICLTVYPRLGIISRAVWEFFFPPFALEGIMAEIAAVGLNGLGFQSIADGRFILFPKGAVEVGWGCNGLDMAITVAAVGLFIGLIFKQSFSEIIKFMTVGVMMAFLANIPRLMLVAVAYVYWGQAWFKFWHGFWGGQVFATVLITFYYYLVMFSVRSPNSPT